MHLMVNIKSFYTVHNTYTVLVQAYTLYRKLRTICEQVISMKHYAPNHNTVPLTKNWSWSINDLDPLPLTLSPEHDILMTNKKSLSKRVQRWTDSQSGRHYFYFLIIDESSTKFWYCCAHAFLMHKICLHINLSVPSSSSPEIWGNTYIQFLMSLLDSYFHRSCPHNRLPHYKSSQGGYTPHCYTGPSSGNLNIMFILYHCQIIHFHVHGL